jgi:polar amino acid transport system substrate-binding protein
MKHALKVILFFFAFSALSSTSYAQQKLVFNAVNFPPYQIQNPEGDLKGFDVELVEKVFAELNIPVEIEYLAWRLALRKSLSGLSTGVFSCSARENYYLSDPISTATDALFFHSDFDFDKYPIEKVSDLKKYPDLKIGGVAGYKILDQLVEHYLPFETSPDDATAFEKLFAGRTDVFLTTKEFAEYTLAQLELRQLVTYKPLKQKHFYICFSKSWDKVLEIRDQFNKVLKQFRNDGTYDAIHNRYR